MKYTHYLAISLMTLSIAADEQPAPKAFADKIAEKIKELSPFQRYSLGAATFTSLTVKAAKDAFVNCKHGKASAYAVLASGLASLGGFWSGNEAYKSFDAEKDTPFLKNVATGTGFTMAAILFPRGKKLSPDVKHSIFKQALNSTKRTAFGSTKLALFGIGANTFSQGKFAEEGTKLIAVAQPHVEKGIQSIKDLIQNK